MTNSEPNDNFNICDCSKVKGRELDYCLGQGQNGRPDPPDSKVKAWRERNCRPNQQPESWDVSQPSRGLGDTIFKFTHATKIAQGVSYVANKLGVDCGCDGRQQTLNHYFPFGRKESQPP